MISELNTEKKDREAAQRLLKISRELLDDQLFQSMAYEDLNAARRMAIQTAGIIMISREIHEHAATMYDVIPEN